MLLRILTILADPGLAGRLGPLVDDLGAVVSVGDDLVAARAQITRRPCDVVLLDGRIATDEQLSIDLISELHADGRCGVVVLSQAESAASRARYLAAGAIAVLDPIVPDALLRESLVQVIERRRSLATLRLRSLTRAAPGLDDLVGSSSTMRAFVDVVRRVAQRDSTVLLLGETGAGKGVLARAIHAEGSRAEGPFIPVNCGAISESLAESELFGHERGAFTGANRSRRGAFETAHGGTLFLDEIGDLPLPQQVKLLTVLEDRAIRPVGAVQAIDVDVRVIAASNRDLGQEVQAGRFRGDLYYRLNVVSLIVPPLRDRAQDIAEIASRALERFSELLHVPVREFSERAIEAMSRHSWPGNVRELLNAVERAVLMCDGSTIELSDLPLEIVLDAHSASPVEDRAVEKNALDARAATGQSLPEGWSDRRWTEIRRDALIRLEREYLHALLGSCEGRVGEAARRAGLDPRSLYAKMKQHRLDKEMFRR